MHTLPRGSMPHWVAFEAGSRGEKNCEEEESPHKIFWHRTWHILKKWREKIILRFAFFSCCTVVFRYCCWFVEFFLPPCLRITDQKHGWWRQVRIICECWWWAPPAWLRAGEPSPCPPAKQAPASPWSKPFRLHLCPFPSPAINRHLKLFYNSSTVEAPIPCNCEHVICHLSRLIIVCGGEYLYAIKYSSC